MWWWIVVDIRMREYFAKRLVIAEQSIARLHIMAIRNVHCFTLLSERRHLAHELSSGVLKMNLARCREIPLPEVSQNRPSGVPNKTLLIHSCNGDSWFKFSSGFLCLDAIEPPEGSLALNYHRKCREKIEIQTAAFYAKEKLVSTIYQRFQQMVCLWFLHVELHV